MSNDEDVLVTQEESQSHVNEAILLPAAATVLALQYEWLRRVSNQISEPYLDEIFHIPQANAFWQGKWSHWDDKITTPPGLYVYSILISKITNLGTPLAQLSVAQLRWTNTFLLYTLAVTCATWLLITRNASLDRMLSTILAIFTFPLFFFFSGLYYTDIFSAVTVMITCCLWQASSQQVNFLSKLAFQTSVFLAGLVALTARQTNIFWVAIFTGGMQLVHSIKKFHLIHDPPLTEAYFEDFPTMAVSVITAALQVVPTLLIDLWPQLGLLGSFAAFVYFNGGVVLGDKTNHVAGIHFAQMLYLVAFITAMSWPLALPHLLSGRKTRSVPRIGIIMLMLLITTTIVHFNTIIHPFLLADNRHFTFYAFKALRRSPWAYYALIPIYVLCAWFVLLAQQIPGSFKSPEKHSVRQNTDINDTSFFAIWLIASSLSLITAPLVEPRYFILPWLLWRLHAPNAGQSSQYEISEDDTMAAVPPILRSIIITIVRRSIWLEILWHLVINFAVCGLFLYRGFTWPQEPGKIQHFMW